MAKVSREVNRLETRISLMETVNDLIGPIAAAIIHEYYFK
jgi:hypothetical protein